MGTICYIPPSVTTLISPIKRFNDRNLLTLLVLSFVGHSHTIIGVMKISPLVLSPFYDDYKVHYFLMDPDYCLKMLRKKPNQLRD